MLVLISNIFLQCTVVLFLKKKTKTFAYLIVVFSLLSLQFAVHYFTDWVCHIHFARQFSAAIHSFWFDQGRRKNIFLVNSFFHHFISVSRGALRFFPLCSHFASGGTARLQIFWAGGEIQTDITQCRCSSQKHMHGERAHVAPNKHLSSLCLRPALKWDRDVVCKWTTSQN